MCLDEVQACKFPARRGHSLVNLRCLSKPFYVAFHKRKVGSCSYGCLHVVTHLFRYGRVESVKILPKRSAEGGRAAFVDFVDIRSATKAHESVNRISDRELRTDYNEPSGTPSSISRMHHDPPARSAPGSPTRAGRRYDRRSEG